MPECTCTMHQLENWGMCSACQAEADKATETRIDFVRRAGVRRGINASIEVLTNLCHEGAGDREVNAYIKAIQALNALDLTEVEG